MRSWKTHSFSDSNGLEFPARSEIETTAFDGVADVGVQDPAGVKAEMAFANLAGLVPASKCEARAECEKITFRALAIIKFVHPARVEIEVVVLT